MSDQWIVTARKVKKGWEAGDNNYLFEAKTPDALREKIRIGLLDVNRLRASYDMPELWALW